MIEANVGIGVLPESTASRHARTMALQIVRLEDEWAERKLQICVADLAALPVFARKLVDLLVEDGLGRQELSGEDSQHRRPSIVNGSLPHGEGRG